MKKGFTLIEILAVVTIIGLIFILVIPKITTSLKNKKKDVDTTTNNLIITAAKNYVLDNISKFDKVDNNTFCLPLTTLTKKDYLDTPIKNVTDDKDITNSKSVKIIYNKGFKYEVVDKKECSVVIVEKEETDFVDKNGNKYKRIDYLESTGTQYIDTNFKPNQNTRVVIDTDIEDTYEFGWYKSIFGVSDNVDGSEINTYSIYFNQSDQGQNRLYTNYYGTVYEIDYYGMKNPEEFERRTYELDRNVFKIEGKIMHTFDEKVFQHNKTMYIFSRNTDTYPNTKYIKMKLYSAQIYDNDILVRNYVPAIDSDYVPCLFDKVENKCYYNQGLGRFKYDVDIPTRKNALSHILSKANNSSVTVATNGNVSEMYTFNHDVTEQTPALTDYRYIGDNPNNYVIYNNEIWRIIGVFSVNDGNDNYEQRIKIVKNDTNNLSKFAWDSDNSRNHWVNASLNKYYNGDYYNSLSDDAQQMITDSRFYLADSIHVSGNISELYASERSNTVLTRYLRYKNWDGKIALMYPSDYGYTFALGIDNTCYNSLGKCQITSGGDPGKSWIFNIKYGGYFTLLTPNSNDNQAHFFIRNTGIVEIGGRPANNYLAFPTLYLKPSVNICSGNGARGNPYVLVN